MKQNWKEEKKFKNAVFPKFIMRNWTLNLKILSSKEVKKV